MSSLVECNKCGWVHFTQTAKDVEEWHQGWLKFWPTLDDEGKAAYGLLDGPPSKDSYYHCFRCGGDYRDFKDTQKDMYGHTIQPILDRNEV